MKLPRRFAHRRSMQPHAEVAVSVCMLFRKLLTFVKRRTTAKFADANTNDGKQVAASFHAPKKYVAPCGNCRFPYVTDKKAEVRAMGAYGKNLLAQIDERRQTSCRVVPLRGIQKNTAPHKVVLYFLVAPCGIEPQILP